MHTASAVFNLRQCSLKLTTPQRSICSTGLRYTLLVILGRDWEWLASWLAITAAFLQFLHSAGLEETLGKFGLISRMRLQRLTEVAHLGCVFKVLVGLGADMPCVMSVAAGGKQCTRRRPNIMWTYQAVVLKAQTHQNTHFFVDCNNSAPFHFVMQHHCHDTRL